MEHSAYIWLGLVGLGVMTIVSRCALLIWPRPVQLPPRVQRALRFAPMAAITGIVVPGIFVTEGVGSLAWDPKTIAAVAVLITWWARRHVGTSMLAGLAVYVVAKLALMNLL